jgi:hypothetical protein
MSDYTHYEDDDRFDTGDANRLQTVRESLPRVLTRGSTIIIDGTPQFKSSPKIHCPRCGEEMRPGQIALHFRHATASRRKQTVDAIQCSCGEYYVSGDIARRAFQAAMTDDLPFDDDKLRGLTTEQLTALIERDKLSQEQLRCIHEIATERLIESRGLAEQVLSRLQGAGAER